MIKKAIYGGIAVVLLSAFFFGRDAASYLGTSVGWVKDSVKNSVPIEFEIERARNLVKNLVPDIRKNMHLVAKEEVQVEQLAKQISDVETRLAADRAELMQLKADAASGKSEFQYAGHRYTINQVKASLASRFERYKTQDATLASLREMHQVRMRSLEAGKQKLEGMLAARQQLTLEVENLEARLKMLEARQTTSEYSFDDSRLSRAKSLIGDLRQRLAVEEKLIDAEGRLQVEIPVPSCDHENIVDEVTEYFESTGHQSAENVSPVDTDKLRDTL